LKGRGRAAQNKRDALRYGGAARSQPLIVSITTAGYDRNSICHEQYRYAKAVMADWRYDPQFFPCIYEMDEGADWKNPEVWPQANPSWGVTIKPEDFAADVREADLSVSKTNAFLRYRMNTWTAQDQRWIKPEVWAACRVDTLPPLDGRECWLGLDLAWSEDTSALVAIFPDAEGGLDVLSRFYLPGDDLPERERRDRVPYGRWAKEGHIVLTPGDVTDYEFIRRDVEEFTKQYRVRMVAVDPYNATHLTNQLDAAGVRVNRYRQGFAGMNAPCRLLENLLANQNIRHANPVMDWQTGNVAIRQNAEGQIRPLKPKAGSTERVDGVLALCMALGAWSEEGQKPARRAPQIHEI